MSGPGSFFLPFLALFFLLSDGVERRLKDTSARGFPTGPAAALDK